MDESLQLMNRDRLEGSTRRRGVSKKLGLVVLLISVGLLLGTFYRHLSHKSRLYLSVVDSPGTRSSEARRIAFDVTSNEYWWTEQFGYFWFEGKESGWTAWQSILGQGGRRSIEGLVRIHGSGRYGKRQGMEIDGLVLLYPGSGALAWRAGLATVEIAPSQQGSSVSMDLGLARIGSGRSEQSVAKATATERLTAQGVEVVQDNATAIHFFRPLLVRLDPRLRQWIRDDEGLQELLPPHVLDWGKETAMADPGAN